MVRRRGRPTAALACALTGFLVLAAAGAARSEIKERVAAVVNGQPITLSDVQDRVQIEMKRLDALPPGPETDRERLDLLKRGLDQLIDEKLIEEEATTLGIEVTDDQTQKLLEALAKQNGMDVPQFREAVQAQGVNWETVKGSVRQQALHDQVLQEKVKPRKVSDAELQAAYAAENAKPEMEVRARHLFIATPPKATQAQLEQAKARADEALRRLKAGEEFAVVARDLSEGPSAKEGGDLGYFRKGTLFPEADAATFALEKGQVSPLIHVATGYHLFQVMDRRPVPPQPFSDVAEELRIRLTNDSVIKERDDYLHSLRKAAQIDIKL